MSVPDGFLERVAAVDPQPADDWVPVIRKVRASRGERYSAPSKGRMSRRYVRVNVRALTPQDLRCKWCGDVANIDVGGVLLCGHVGCSTAEGVVGRPARTLWEVKAR